MSIVFPCIPHFTSWSRYVDGVSQCSQLLFPVVVLAMFEEAAADSPSSSRMMCGIVAAAPAVPTDRFHLEPYEWLESSSMAWLSPVLQELLGVSLAR